MKKNYLVFDTETTGLSYKEADLLQLYFEVVDPETFQVLDSLHILTKPLPNPEGKTYFSVNPMAMKINNINLAEHEKVAKTYESAQEEIRSFILKNATFAEPVTQTENDNYNENTGIAKGCFSNVFKVKINKLIPVGQAYNFDIEMILNKMPELRTLWEDSVERRGLDTGVINTFLKTTRKLPSSCPSSLSDVAKYFGMDNTGAHDACKDVEMTKFVLRKYLEIGSK